MSSFQLSNIPEDSIRMVILDVLSDRGIEPFDSGYKFRCPICGDSKKDINKKRGFILYNNIQWTFDCKNECGQMSLFKFLKHYHSNEYKKLIFKGYSRQENNIDRIKLEIIKKKKNTHNIFKEGQLISIFSDDPLALKGLQYCIERKIPKEVYSKWFVCLWDNKFIHKDERGNIIYNKKGFPKGNEYGNRLIIPYYHLGGSWFQFDARSLDNSFIKYRNLEEVDREMYNIDFLDYNKPFFMLEGAINSTFIKNSVSFGGTKHLNKFLTEHPQLLKYSHNGTVIWDNDDAGYNEILFTVERGFNWFNWSKIQPKKEFLLNQDGTNRIINDINDLVLYGDVQVDEKGYINTSCLEPYIENDTLGGARIKLTQLYGNRDKIKKEQYKKAFNKSQKATTSFNW